MKYSPAKGLVKLFNRMSRRQKNPNAARTQPPKCSYVDILWLVMNSRGNSSQENRPGMGHRGHGVGGNRAGQVDAFGRPPIHCQFIVQGGPQFQGSRGGGGRFDHRDHRRQGFDGPNWFEHEQFHQQQWEEVHNAPNKHHHGREEPHASQGGTNTEGARGLDSRREIADSKQDATKTRSMEIKGEHNPNMLDMSQLPPTALYSH
jgi:hypothetical protein